MNRKKVLIVEDQIITSISLTDNLTAIGYEVVGVEKSAENALNFLETNIPDIILMDIYLKTEMTGIEAAQIINEKYQLPIIFLTASTNEKVFEKAKMDGVYGFIIKPFDIKEVKISIEIALFKHEIELKIKKDKYFLSEAQRIANVGHWELNIESGELKWSEETYRIFEVDSTKSEASYRMFMDLVHPEDRQLVDKTYRKSLINKTPYSVEHRLLFNDGRVKYVKETGESFYNEKGDAYLSLGTVQDITEAKESELALKQSEENFKDLFYHSIDQVYLVELDTLKIIDVNKIAIDELGYSLEEIKEKNIYDIVVDIEEAKTIHNKLLRLKQGEMFSFCTEHRRKDKSVVSINLKVKIITYSGKQILMALAENITEKLIYEKKREEDKKVRNILNQLLSLTLEDKTLQQFLDEALDLILTLPYFENLSKAAIFSKKDENTLELISHVNFEENHLNACSQVKKGFCMCGLTFQTKKVQYACCNDNQYQVKIISNQDIGNYNVPIINKDEVIGVLSIYLQKNHKKDFFEIEILETVASTLGVILMRKQNQEALTLSENRFRELAETIKEVFWLIDFNTKKLLYVSPAYEDIYEKSCDSLYKDHDSWIERVHPDDKEKVLNEYGGVKEEGIKIEYRLLMPDGRVKWVHDNTFPIYEKGKVVRMAGYSVDITESKNVEEELRISEEKFRTYVENSADVITIVDKQLNILYNSPNNELIFGYNSTENIGKKSSLFIKPDDLIIFQKSFELSIQKTSMNFEYRYKHKSKKWIWIESSVKYIEENTDEPYFIINSRDISERKAIEEELKESENRYRSLFENNLSGIYQIGMDYKILEANDAFAKIIGFNSRTEIIGKDANLLYEGEKEFCKALYENGGKLKSFEIFITLKSNNKKVRILENASLVFSENGEPLYYEGSVIDTTSLLEIEKEKKAFEIIPAENPNPVIRVDYNFNVLYVNDPGKKLLTSIGNTEKINNPFIIESLNHIILDQKKNNEIEFKNANKFYLLFMSNVSQFEYINIYAADITELKNTQSDYLKLSLDLERLVEQRTNELNTTVERLNREIKEKLLIEDQIKNSLKEKEVLLNEITHRVKNNLQVVSSLLSLQKESIENAESLQLLSDTSHRIKSMALIHETLYKSNNFSQINFKSYIDSLVYYILNSFDTCNINIDCFIEELNLTIDTATSCGMIIMELITNSLKYAFSEGEKGNIILKMNRVDEENYKLIISDDGKGYPDNLNFSNTKTLGMQLVVGLTSQLQGTIRRLESEGTSFEIIFKDTKRHKYEKN